MPTAREIVDRVNAGEVLTIPRRFLNTFTEQLSAHGINCALNFKVGRRDVTIRSAQTPARHDSTPKKHLEEPA